jgi:hypothetical protein
MTKSETRLIVKLLAQKYFEVHNRKERFGKRLARRKIITCLRGLMFVLYEVSNQADVDYWQLVDCSTKLFIDHLRTLRNRERQARKVNHAT